MLNSKAIIAALAVTLSLAGVSESFARGGHGFGGGGGGGGGGMRFSGGGGGGARFMGGGGGVAHFSGARMGGSNFVARGPSNFVARGPSAGARFAGPVGVRPGWNGGGRYAYHNHRRFFGPGIGFAAGLALGGAYAYSPYYYGDDYYDNGYGYQGGYGVSDAVINACMQRYGFVSYDPQTNTYIGGDGGRYQCSL